MGNSSNFTLGLDLAQASFDAAIAPEGADVKTWRTLAHTHIDTSPDSAEGINALLGWLAAAAPDGRCLGVVVESTGTLSRRVAARLNKTNLGGVAIVNPRLTKSFGDSLGVRDKSDRIDCAILAAYGMERKPAPTTLRSRADEELRELTRLREAMIADKTAWQSRLKQATSTLGRRQAEATIAFYEKQIEDAEAKIDKHIAKDEVLRDQVKALKAIPGIGVTTARTLTAELGDLRVYSRGQIVAAAGMFPVESSSGETVRRRRLIKGGGARLRRVLYMCATSLFYSKGPMRAWIEVRLQKGLAPMVVVTMVMRKLLTIARAMMVAGGHFDPSLIGKQETFAV